jgi:hypothetical protein
MTNWRSRVTQLCAIAMGVLLYVQVVHGAAMDGDAVTPVNEFERWGRLVERVGFCLVGFGILGYLLYRQSALEGITKRYDETQQAHLKVFEQINEAYSVMQRDTKDTILLAVQVQTTLTAKLDAMERHYGK